MNKRLINLPLLAIFLISLFSFIVNAAGPLDAIGDAFGRGFSVVEEFLTGGWMAYEKTVAFIVFFILFFSTYLIGMKNAFKELTRPHKVFAFTVAMLSAFIIVTSMRFDWINLKYVAWGLLGFLILLLLYFLLSKLELLKNKKFWIVILVLILTALLLWLIWYLWGEGMPFEGTGDWFEGLGREEFEVEPKVEDKKKIVDEKGLPWGWIGGIGGGGLLGIIALIALLKLKGGRPPEERLEEEEAPEEEKVLGADLISRWIRYLIWVSNKKENVDNGLIGLEKKKNEILGKTKTLRLEIERVGGIEEFMADVAPYLRSLGSDEFNRRVDENENLKELKEYNYAIFDVLRIFGSVENGLLNTIQKNNLQNIITDSRDKGEIIRLLSNLNGVSSQIISLLRELFIIEKQEGSAEKNIIELLKKEHLEERVKEGWIMALATSEKRLKELIPKEFAKFSNIKALVGKENEIIQKIIEILEKERKKQIKEIIITIPAEDGYEVAQGGEIELEVKGKEEEIDKESYSIRWFIKHPKLPTGRDWKPMIISERSLAEQLEKINPKVGGQSRADNAHPTEVDRLYQELFESRDTLQGTQWGHKEENIDKIRGEIGIYFDSLRGKKISEEGKARIAVYKKYLEKLKKIDEVKKGNAVGEHIFAWIPTRCPTGKARIIARLFDQEGKGIAQSNERIIDIIKGDRPNITIQVPDPQQRYRVGDKIGGLVADVTGVEDESEYKVIWKIAVIKRTIADFDKWSELRKERTETITEDKRDWEKRKALEKLLLEMRRSYFPTGERNSSVEIGEEKKTVSEFEITEKLLESFLGKDKEFRNGVWYFARDKIFIVAILTKEDKLINEDLVEIKIGPERTDDEIVDEILKGVKPKFDNTYYKSYSIKQVRKITKRVKEYDE